MVLYKSLSQEVYASFSSLHLPTTYKTSRSNFFPEETDQLIAHHTLLFRFSKSMATYCKHDRRQYSNRIGQEKGPEKDEMKINHS